MRFDQNTELYLFKTPLDEKYRNVYDNYENYLDYHNFLLHFPSIRIDISNLKSSLDTNGRFSVVIANYNSMDLHDYNYIEFITKGIRKFAFITSIQSQNDGPVSCACQLFCKLDAWTNHYFELRNSNQYYPTIRCTYDNFYDIYYPTELQKFRFPTQRVFERSLSYRGSTFVNGKRVVLWQKVLVSKTVVLGAVPFTAYDNLQQTGGLIPIYRPVALIDLTTRNPVSCKIRLNGTPIGGGSIVTLFEEDYTKHPYYEIAGVDGTYALENTLTYMLPRVYDIQTTIEDDIEIATITLDYNGRYGSGTAMVRVEGNDSPLSDLSVKFFVCDNSVSPYALLDTITVTMPTVPSTPSRYNTSLTALVRSEHYSAEYPFNYYSIIINGQEYPLIPSNTTSEVSSNFQIITYINDMMARSYRVVKNVDDDKTIKLNMNTSKLLTRIDQLEQYLDFNRNQINTQLVNTGIKSGVGAISAGLMFAGVAALSPATAAGVLATAGAGIAAGSSLVSGITTTLGEYAEQQARQADIANRPDIFNSTSPEAQFNMYYGDDVILVKNTVYYSPAVEDMFRSIHHNGIVTPKMIPIFTRRRDVFDVISADASLKVQIANDDRTELESAIKDGITFWHLNNYSQSLDRTDILMKMDKNVVNLCVSQIPIGG